MTQNLTPTPGKRRGGRRKGSPATRDAILQAAVELFAERGYDGTALRAITDRAGVDVAMVSHFFGNKQGLFEEAVFQRGSENINFLLEINADGRVATQLLEAYLSMWEDPATALIVRAVFRAALESEDHRARLEQLMGAKLAGAIRLLTAERGDTTAGTTSEITIRTQLIAAHLLGIGIARYILQLAPLATTPRETLIALVAPVLEAYLPARE